MEDIQENTTKNYYNPHSCTLEGWSEKKNSVSVSQGLCIRQGGWQRQCIHLKLSSSKIIDHSSTRIERNKKCYMHFVCLICVRVLHGTVVSRWAGKNDLNISHLLSIYTDTGAIKSFLGVA